MTVGYLGPEGTFTHGAATQLGGSADLVPLSSQSEAIAALSAGTHDAVVLPVDNSVHGLVLPTWDALLDSEDAVIVDDVTVEVSFDAFVVDPDVEPTVVVSHPHALAQCSAYVARTGLPTRAASSTAEACRSLAPGEIAIAAPLCAELYGVTPVATAVEDLTGATTQFALIRRGLPGTPLQPPSPRSISLLVVVPRFNRPGSLLEVLQPFSTHGLNLVNILARPIAQSYSEFMFLLFVEGLDEEHAHRPIVEEFTAQGSIVVSLGRLKSQVKNQGEVPRALPMRLRHATV